MEARIPDGRPKRAAGCRRSRSSRRLADVATEIEAARLLVQRAAWMGRNGMPMPGGQGSMSKLKGGDVTMWATTTLMDLVGPDAWNTEYPLEKFFRDGKIYQLFEGTAEIQRMVISRMQARDTPSVSATAPKWPPRRWSEAGAGPRGAQRLGRSASRRGPSTLAQRARAAWAFACAGRSSRGYQAADVDRPGDQRRSAPRRGGRRSHHRFAGGAGRRRAPALRRRLDRPRSDRGAWPLPAS